MQRLICSTSLVLLGPKLSLLQRLTPMSNQIQAGTWTIALFLRRKRYGSSPKAKCIMLTYRLSLL